MTTGPWPKSSKVSTTFVVRVILASVACLETMGTDVGCGNVKPSMKGSGGPGEDGGPGGTFDTDGFPVDREK